MASVLSANCFQVADGFNCRLKAGLFGAVVEPVVRVDGWYYREVLLKQQMLPVMHRIAGDVFVFQQDNAPAH